MKKVLLTLALLVPTSGFAMVERATREAISQPISRGAETAISQPISSGVAKPISRGQVGAIDDVQIGKLVNEIKSKDLYTTLQKNAQAKNVLNSIIQDLSNRLPQLTIAQLRKMIADSTTKRTGYNNQLERKNQGIKAENAALQTLITKRKEMVGKLMDPIKKQKTQQIEKQIRTRIASITAKQQEIRKVKDFISAQLLAEEFMKKAIAIKQEPAMME